MTKSIFTPGSSTINRACAIETLSSHYCLKLKSTVSTLPAVTVTF